MASAGSKCIPVTGFTYKQAITATFGVIFDTKFLPMQLIYEGKISQSLPWFKFHNSFSLSVNPKHFNKTEESVKLLNEIATSYVAAWRYNTKQEQQLIDLYWNIRTSASRWFYYKTLLWNFKYCRVQIEKVSYWLSSKQSMSNHVSLC